MPNVVCCVCGKIIKKIETATGQDSHSYCPKCEEEFINELKAAIELKKNKKKTPNS